MIKQCYRKLQGKIPYDQKAYEEIPSGDYGILYSPDVAMIDIDDYDHSTNKLVEPIKDEPRSKAIIQMLDDCNIRYNGIKTEHGVHLVFKKPSDYLLESNKNDWYCSVGVKIEAKVKTVIEPIVVNGIKRKCFKGDFLNDQIDELPVYLYPIQKSKYSSFESGNRNNGLSEYAFYLANKGITANAVNDIIRKINKYVIEEPMSDYELDVLLRNDTMEKLRQKEQRNKEKGLYSNKIGNEIIEHFSLITCSDQIYGYKKGVYSPMTEGYLGSCIRKKHLYIKSGFKKEVLEYIKDVTYTELKNEKDDLINVKNGLLKINSNGTVDLLPHDKNIIKFTQFNAVYNPNIRSTVLETTLNKFFDGDPELIELFEQILGYLLMNHVNYGKCFFFVGRPSSGKSKILNMITNFCGKSNVSGLSLRDLDDKYRPEILLDKIANINADLEKAMVKSTGNFKSLVTGDGITVEQNMKNLLLYSTQLNSYLPVIRYRISAEILKVLHEGL